MGDPRKLRKKFSKPSHPWQKLRIEEEKVLMKEYGFKNKIELWRLNTMLRKFKHQVKELIPRRDEEAENQKKHLLQRIHKLNLIKENAILEDILAVSLKDLCERRLQTILLRKQMARSIKQARQFITHEHIMVGNRKITSPSYIVSSAEEAMVKLADSSPMVSEEHPERIPVQKKLTEEMHAAGLKERTEVKPKRTRKSAAKEFKAEVKREVAEEKKE